MCPSFPLVSFFIRCQGIPSPRCPSKSKSSKVPLPSFARAVVAASPTKPVLPGQRVQWAASSGAPNRWTSSKGRWFAPSRAEQVPIPKSHVFWSQKMLEGGSLQLFKVPWVSMCMWLFSFSFFNRKGRCQKQVRAFGKGVVLDLDWPEL